MSETIEIVGTDPSETVDAVRIVRQQRSVLGDYYLGNGLYDFNSPAIRRSDHNNLFYSGDFGMTF
jgi:hypothetical protein